MTWLNKLLGRPAPNVHVMDAGKRVVRTVVAPDAFRSPVLLARGKWVMHEQGIGIIADINAEGICEVHLVDDKGLTFHRLNSHISKVRVARLMEIPEARRPSVEHGASLGYV